MASIYAGLKNLTVRESDGSNNDGDNNPLNDTGQYGDAYVRITEAQYVTNKSDGTFGAPFNPFAPPGPNGMVLPVAPTNPPPIPLPFQDQLRGNMPQARAISDAVMALAPDDQNHPSTFASNELFDFFGQFVTHDVAEASTGNSGDMALLIDGLPFPFGRTPGEVDDAGVRQQHNDETAFFDLSMVYGNNDARLDLARADTSAGSGVQSAKLLLGAGGLLPTIKEVAINSGIDNDPTKSGSLEVLQIFTEAGFGGLPDPATNPADSTFENLYYAGDNRVNQQAPLISLQTTWAREHNYQVDQLTPIATAEGWTQDELFNAARAINEAEFQHVVYDEYVPKLIGSHADDLLSNYKSFVGEANYDAIPVGIINEWATVAFRLGHDQSSNDYTLLNADGSTYLQTTLGNAFNLAGSAANVPGAGHSATDVAAWIRGLSAQFSQQIDGFVADGNRNVLFGIPGGAVDLEAFDIQRGRDHGVWNYNSLRAGLGLSTYATFTEFALDNGYAADDDRIVALRNVYGGDDKISILDSIVGGLLEAKYADSQLGETFTLINAIQFDLLKNDSFFYENRLADNPELLARIKGTTMAEIMGRSGGVDHLNLNTFQVANRIAYNNGNNIGYGADLAGVLGADLMIGGGGNDSLFGKEGSDTLYGDTGNDNLNGGNGDDFLRGGDGNDTQSGGAGNDNAAGEAGHDSINLGDGDDWASGGDGNDFITGGNGNDTMLGDAGNDNISGGNGDDQAFGGDGVDNLSGDAGNDELDGGNGNDNLAGGIGNDILRGGDGNDTLNGGPGNDRLEGGPGNDIETGGPGSDTFVFKPGFGNDRITDFDANPAGGQDYIELSGFGIDATNFAAHVTITDVGADVLVTIDGNASQTIRLVGIPNASVITVDDFRFS